MECPRTWCNDYRVPLKMCLLPGGPARRSRVKPVLRSACFTVPLLQYVTSTELGAHPAAMLRKMASSHSSGCVAGENVS